MAEVVNRVERKRDREVDLVSEMIRVYCKKKHGTKNQLCSDCDDLMNYARQRSMQCPFMESKTFCSTCTVHCYKPSMREKIREVMRTCGPWMMLYHPILSIKHLIAERKNKMKLEREDD